MHIKNIVFITLSKRNEKHQKSISEWNEREQTTEINAQILRACF